MEQGDPALRLTPLQDDHRIVIRRPIAVDVAAYDGDAFATVWWRDKIADDGE